MERSHALLSASGSHRWLNCPPSARLEELHATSQKYSTFADEGTLAHSFGELELRLFAGEIDKKNYTKELNKLQKHDLYYDGMMEEVAKYVDYVKLAMQEKKQANLLIEKKLDFSNYVESGFGTGDAVVITPEEIEIIDLKFGKGVQIYANENPQLMLYALGAITEFEFWGVERVTITIIQPRLDHFDSFLISTEDLKKWGENFVKPRAALAYEGKGEQTPGEHCKFCKVKAMCRALAEANTSLAKHDFKDPNFLSDDELLVIYGQQAMLVDWVEAVADYMLEKAKSGKEWEGYKLVEGRSQRKWTDEEKAKEILSFGYEFDDYMQVKLAGIGDIEKLVGKNKFPVLLENCFDKPAGAPVLVPNTDKRPPIKENAKNDFKN